MSLVRLASRFWLFIAITVFSSASTVRASFHLWKFDEIFSNADGSQQFIRMHSDFEGQQFLNTDAGGSFGPAQINSSVNFQVFVFPNDLPLPSAIGHDTGGRQMLLATTGFKPGGVTPDFSLPAKFFATVSDSLNFTATDFSPVLDSINWDALPTDGVNALFQTPGTTTKTPDLAAPVNFAGESGSSQPIPLPAGVGMGAVGLVSLAIVQQWKRRRAA